jgi:hypothetical protein
MIFYTIFFNKTSDEIWNKKNQTICNLKWFMQCAHGRLEMKMQRGIRAGERDHVGGQQGRDPAGRDSAKLTSSVARSENASGQLAVLVGKGLSLSRSRRRSAQTPDGMATASAHGHDTTPCWQSGSRRPRRSSRTRAGQKSESSLVVPGRRVL